MRAMLIEMLSAVFRFAFSRCRVALRPQCELIFRSAVNRVNRGVCAFSEGNCERSFGIDCLSHLALNRTTKYIFLARCFRFCFGVRRALESTGKWLNRVKITIPFLLSIARAANYLTHSRARAESVCTHAAPTVRAHRRVVEGNQMH